MPGVLDENQKTINVFSPPSFSQREVLANSDLETEKEEEKKDLDEFVQEINTHLLRIKSIFPFEFFPDELIVDQNKVTIVKNYFYFSKQMRNILLDDIGDVMIETGPFFATLIILDKSSGNAQKEEMKVGFLPKNKALKFRRLIEGLITCRKENVDLSGRTEKEICLKVEEIGKTVE